MKIKTTTIRRYHSGIIYSISSENRRRPHAENKSIRLFPHGKGRGSAYESRQRHHHDGLGYRAARKQESARLLDDQGRHPCLRALACHASHRQRYPRQRGGARTGVDPAQSRRSGSQRHNEVRERYSDGTPGTARVGMQGSTKPAGKDAPRDHRSEIAGRQEPVESPSWWTGVQARRRGSLARSVR
jgi:hypothetical protein